MTQIKLFRKYLKNDRMKEYENIIKIAQQKNYEVISLRDYIEKNYDTSKKLFILRHDVDHFSDGTKMMFEIEKKYSVKSSFYFRNSTFEPKLMKDIEEYGSEASLHFEPIADFVKVNNIKNKDELLTFKNWEKRNFEILKANIERFRNLLDIDCVTIASHGEHENSLVQIPNNYLTEDVATYNDLGIKLEAYNKKMIDKVTCYISDVPIEINSGYKYGVSPLEAIAMEEPFIMFLTHPNHWYYSLTKQFKKLIKTVVIKPLNIKMEFKRV